MKTYVHNFFQPRSPRAWEDGFQWRNTNLLHPPRHQYAFPRVEQSQDSHTYDTLLPFIPLHCPSHLVRTDTHIREKEKRREEIRAEKLSLLLRIRGWMLFGSWSPLLSWIEPRKAKRGRGGGRGGGSAFIPLPETIIETVRAPLATAQIP